jgi:predicted MPP superfamily phosphohydrolase
MISCGRNPGLVSRLISRLFLSIFILLTLACGYAHFIEPRAVVLERVEVPVKDLPQELDGFTIGVMADLHLETTPLVTIARAVQKLVEEGPEISVIVGDFAEDASSLSDIDEVLEPLGRVYGVPGNWDRWTESHDYQDLIGVEMLVNRGVSPAGGLWLCGIDTALLGYPSLDDAVAGAPEGSIVILLAHEPDIASWIEPRHNVSLQISGHSHGGQIRLPIVGSVLLPPLGEEYPMGLKKTPGHWVYTTRGLGMSHIPMRFLCPPEVTLITLVRPER